MVKLRLFILVLLSGLIGTALQAQTWQAIAPMKEARWFHSSVILNDGRILVAGGKNEGAVLNSAELYDPVADTWTPTGSMSIPRCNFTMYKLVSGKVIAAGGLNDFGVTTTETSEIYDPVKGSWSAGPSMSDPREGHSGVVFPDGKILFVGGLNANIPTALASCDLYDPVANSMTRFAPKLIPEYGSSIHYVPSINSLVAPGGEFGGTGGYYLRSTQLYSFTTNSWMLADSIATDHTEGLQHLQMPDGTIVLPSGRTGESTLTSDVEYFDATAMRWKIAGSLLQQRVVARSFAFSIDTFLIIGGLNGDVNNLTAGQKLGTCEYFSMKTGKASAGPSMITRRCFFSAENITLRGEGPCQTQSAIYVFGGYIDLNHTTNLSERLILKGHDPKATASIQPTSIFASGLPCTPLDTMITIKSLNCAGMTIDSVTSAGLINTSFSKVFPYVLAGGDSIGLQIKTGVLKGAMNGVVTINYSVSGKSFKQTLTIIPGGSMVNPTIIHALISDHDLVAGDTLTLPIYFVPSNWKIGGAQLDLEYNSDLLECLDPIYTGQSVIDLQRSKNHASLLVLDSLTSSSVTPILKIRFRTFVTDTICTTVHVSVVVDPLDPKTNNCTLSVIDDSARICLTPKCGDSHIRQFLRTGSLMVESSTVDDGQLILTLSRPIQNASCEIYDILGSLKFAAVASGKSIKLNTEGLRSGGYVVRIVSNGQVTGSRFNLTH
jgi:hypothetical protein